MIRNINGYKGAMDISYNRSCNTYIYMLIYICTYMRYTGVFNGCKSQVSQQSQLFQALLFFSRSFNFLPG